MNFLQELKNFIKSILYWIYVLIGISFIFFSLPAKKSFSVLVFDRMKDNLLPRGVSLIVTNPMSAFLADMGISITMAFIVTFPLILSSVAIYLFPALHEEEKKTFLKLAVPSSLLFVTGCIFSYLFLVPPTFKILYSFTSALGAVPFFTVGEFVYSVLGLVITAGFMFLLPIFMFLLSWMNLIEEKFWKDNWRYAFLLFLVFSAIITPDGTGITMLILTVPLFGLYGLGVIMSGSQSGKGRKLLNA